MKAFPVTCLLILNCILTGCMSSQSQAARQSGTRSADYAALIERIVAAWESADGSRVTRPPAWDGVSFRGMSVSAAWWGFDPTDSTNALQAAVDSDADVVLVPRMPEPWVLSRTLYLGAGSKEILFEPGVVLLAAKGAFRGAGEGLIDATGSRDLTLSGYGATLRMRKADYQKAPYDAGEWRHAINLRGVERTRIEGFVIESSGGDGVYVGTLGPRSARVPSQDIVLQDLDIRDNHRQGISVTSARRLLIQNCDITGTHGTLPMAGIDFEPNGGDPGFEDCTVRACRISANTGAGILLELRNLGADSAPVSIRIEDCSIGNWPLSLLVSGLQNHARGGLSFLRTSFSGLRFAGGTADFSITY